MPADSDSASELHQNVQEVDLGSRGAAKRDGGGMRPISSGLSRSRVSGSVPFLVGRQRGEPSNQGIQKNDLFSMRRLKTVSALAPLSFGVTSSLSSRKMDQIRFRAFELGRCFNSRRAD